MRCMKRTSAGERTRDAGAMAAATGMSRVGWPGAPGWTTGAAPPRLASHDANAAALSRTGRTLQNLDTTRAPATSTRVAGQRIEVSVVILRRLLQPGIRGDV